MDTITIAIDPAVSPLVAPLDLPLAWQYDLGTLTLAGTPGVLLWTPTSLAEFLGAIYRAAGEQRYGYILQAQGRKGVASDWVFMQTFDSFLAGLQGINRVAIAAGWGRMELVTYDIQRKEAVVRVYNAWEAASQRALGVCWGTHYFAGKIAGWFTYHFEVNCWATQQRFFADGDPYDEFVVAESSRDVQQELARIEHDEAERQQVLEHIVIQRTQELHAVITTLEQAKVQMEQQAHAIQSLSIPVVQLWKDILMVPLIGHIDALRANLLMERVLASIASRSARVVLIDITGVVSVDTMVVSYLIQTVQAVRLLGAQAMVVGISPEIAQTIVTLGIDLRDIETSANMQQGLQKAFSVLGLA